MYLLVDNPDDNFTKINTSFKETMHRNLVQIFFEAQKALMLSAIAFFQIRVYEVDLVLLWKDLIGNQMAIDFNLKSKVYLNV